MTGFIEIPADFLKVIARHDTVGGLDRVPTLYFSPYPPVRRFFWMRLRLVHRLIAATQTRFGSVLDFGGGGGTFLPTLSSSFQRVVSVDLVTDEAVAVRDRYDIRNADLVRGDVSDLQLADAPFDAVVAADVLEHFRDLAMPVDRILDWLASDGVLYTSLPTESWLYVLLRKVFGVTKPEDHYHTAAEVEAYLASRGLKAVRRSYVPLRIPLFSLFRVTAWKRETPRPA
jgi:predicted TPR repeat methyltransferase